MNAYRRHFVRLNMALVGAVLLITLLAVGGSTIQSEYKNMRQTMLETLMPFQNRNALQPFIPDGTPRSEETDTVSSDGQTALQQRDTPQPPQNGADPGGDGNAFFSRCITVFYSNGQGTILSGINDADEETVLAAAAQAMEQSDSLGYLREYDMFYQVAGRDAFARLSLYPARYLRQSIIGVVVRLLIAFLLTMVAFYWVSRYISKIAIRPVEIAMNREKQFVADISHDLKTPLAVMQACYHILLENPEQTIAQAQPWMEKSSAAMQNMKTLIGDMLTMSAVDTAQRLPKKEIVNFSAVVTKAVLQMDVMAYDRGITLEPSVQENIIVTGDADALLRVASGLIENALKYEPKNGHISVSLAGRGRKTVLTVQNFGSVIAPEDLPHVFERFYRGDKARTAQQGHGLGLAIIKRTVELMDGKIEAASALETGTVFTVIFG